MGQSSSSPLYHEAVPKGHGSGSHVVISKEPPSSFSFNVSESYIVSYGIDLQTSPNYSDHTLPPTVLNGARKVMDAFINTGTIPKSNASLYAASKDPEQCKISGMKHTFQESAKKAGQNGLFVFLFSGHGIKFKQSNEWILVPADFNYTRDTYLTPDVLGQWLVEANCRAMHTLFILDCCYAGGVATTLTEFADLPVKGSFSVLSACTANQSSTIITPLEHSTFTFFLSHFISTLCMSGVQKPDSIEFPLKTIFSECQICSKALSSLFIQAGTTDSIMIKVTEPQLDVVYPKPDVPAEGARNNRIVADTCEEEIIPGIKYAYELYNDSSRPELEDHTKKIIHIWQLPDGPLSELNERHLLAGQVLNAALCSMMYSVATVELSCRDGRKKVTNADLSITAFIQIATALDKIVTDLAIPKNFFFQSWLFYLKGLDSNGVDISDFVPLIQKFKRDVEYYPSGIRSNQSDSVNRGATANKRIESDSDDFMETKLKDLLVRHVRPWLPINGTAAS